MEMDIFNLWQQLVHDISVYCYFQVACSLCTFHICIPVRGACISYGFSMYFFCCFFFVQFLSTDRFIFFSLSSAHPNHFVSVRRIIKSTKNLWSAIVFVCCWAHTTFIIYCWSDFVVDVVYVLFSFFLFQLIPLLICFFFFFCFPFYFISLNHRWVKVYLLPNRITLISCCSAFVLRGFVFLSELLCCFSSDFFFSIRDPSISIWFDRRKFR